MYLVCLGSMSLTSYGLAGFLYVLKGFSLLEKPNANASSNLDDLTSNLLLELAVGDTVSHARDPNVYLVCLVLMSGARRAAKALSSTRMGLEWDKKRPKQRGYTFGTIDSIGNGSHPG